MLYLLVPRMYRSWTDLRVFLSYAAAEAVALQTARAIEAGGGDPDWCILVGMEGVDEVLPHFLYTLVDSRRLHREPWPSPSP